MDATALAEHPFFDGIRAASVADVAPHARVREFRPGKYLLREGEDANSVYFLLRGSVSLETRPVGRPTTRLETVGAPGVVGLSWMFPPYRVHLDARALEDVSTISIDAPALREAMLRDEHLGCAVMHRLLRVLYDRLERVRLQRLDVYGA